MISAVSWQPAQGFYQFRSQLDTTGIYLKTALKYFAAAADNIEKTTRGPGIEYIAAFILDFFKTAFPALLAATVPISIFGEQICRHLFLTLLDLGFEHIRQRAHPLRSVIRLTTEFRHRGLLLIGNTGRSGQSE